jgi:hypothetical protein
MNFKGFMNILYLLILANTSALSLKADICFTNISYSFNSCEFVVVGYVDSMVYEFNGLPAIYVFVIEESYKGFDANDQWKPSVINIIAGQYASIGEGRQVVFLKRQLAHNLYFLEYCSWTSSWFKFHRYAKHEGLDFPSQQVVQHDGFDSEEYKHLEINRRNVFTLTNGLIAELEKEYKNYRILNLRLNQMLSGLSLLTFVLAIFSFHLVFRRTKKRATSEVAPNPYK